MGGAPCLRYRFGHADHGVACRLECGIVEGPFCELRGVAGRQQHQIAFAQGHVEHLGEPEEHVAAGSSPARFDEAQVPGRDFAVARQIQLAAAPAVPPFTDEIPDRRRRRGLHAQNHSAGMAHRPLPVR